MQTGKECSARTCAICRCRSVADVLLFVLFVHADGMWTRSEL